MMEVEVACTDDAYHEMERLAAAAYPNEGCGVLIGGRTPSRVEIVAVTNARNLNTERSRDRYLMDPQDMLRADRDARDRGVDVVGYWHSHPDHPAAPSRFDTDHAWADLVYIICATSKEGTGDVNAFTLQDEGGDFVPMLLIVAPQDRTPAP